MALGVKFMSRNMGFDLGTANIRYEAVMLPWEVTQVLAPERESPVALNMVIAQDTEYVLLDEPTNDLDIHHAANLMKTVRAGEDGDSGPP